MRIVLINVLPISKVWLNRTYDDGGGASNRIRLQEFDESRLAP